MVAKHDEVASVFQSAALAASDVGTWELDIGRDLFRGDEVTASIYGLPAAGLVVGVPFDHAAARVHPEDRAMWRARREVSLRYGGMFVIEYRVLSETGDIRWVLVRGRYEMEHDGVVTHARGVVIDLTESKRDGFADGYATFVDAESEDGEIGTLEQVANHALGAHRALSRPGGPVRPALLLAADRLLQEVGLAIAKLRPPAKAAKRH